MLRLTTLGVMSGNLSNLETVIVRTLRVLRFGMAALWGILFFPWTDVLSAKSLVVSF